MSGPSVSRSPVNAAPIAELADPTRDFLSAFLTGSTPGTPGTPARGGAGFRLPATPGTPGRDLGLGGDLLSRMQALLGQPSALQQQTGNTFSQLLSGPTAQERTFNIALPAIQQQLTGTPGMDVLDAASPLFQRNLSDALQQQRQFGGPRFAAESGRQASQLQQRSLQDFNLFSQNVLEAGRQRQLQAAGVLGQLGQGVDMSRLGIAQGAGQFSLGQSGQQNAMLQFLLAQALGAGGAQTPAVLQQNPGFLGQLGSLAGAGVGIAGGLFGAGGMFGQGGAFGPRQAAGMPGSSFLDPRMLMPGQPLNFGR